MARWNNRSQTSTQQRPAKEITREAIAKRAYEKFLTRGGAHGDDLKDWLEAEQELRAQTQRSLS